jgi:hypothetical protein
MAGSAAQQTIMQKAPSGAAVVTLAAKVTTLAAKVAPSPATKAMASRASPK